ncbi:MAG: hypothetical protein DRJ67_12455, partial [Thermoprotei archaeon]
VSYYPLPALDEEELEELVLAEVAEELRRRGEEQGRTVWKRVRIGEEVYRIVYDYWEEGVYAVPQEAGVINVLEVRGRKLPVGLELFNFFDPDLGGLQGYKLVKGEPLFKILHLATEGPLRVERHPLHSVPRDLKYICVKRRYCAERGWLDWRGAVDVEQLLRAGL